MLIGATAMGFHGVVRATEDLDLIIRATPENVGRLRGTLKRHMRTIRISMKSLRLRYPAIRYYPPSGDLYFDILTRLGESASFDTVEAEPMSSRHARAGTPAALYRLKKGTVRAKDQQDAAALRDRFHLKDEEE